jgi:hypothetical protein
MTVKLTRLTHKIRIILHLVAESCKICSSRSSRTVRELLDTPSHLYTGNICCSLSCHVKRTQLLVHTELDKDLKFTF